MFVFVFVFVEGLLRKCLVCIHIFGCEGKEWVVLGVK